MHKQHKIKLFAGALMLFFITSLFAQAPNTLWTKTYGGAGTDVGYCVQQTSDNGYIVAGKTGSFGAGGGDVYFIKTNSLGDTVWTKTYGGTENDEGRSVQQTTDGGYIVAGTTRSFGAGNTDFYLVKTNADGDTIWTKTYGGTSWDECYSVQQTSDGGYILCGDTQSFGPSFINAYVVKTDSLGDTLWTWVNGGGFFWSGNEAIETSDTAYVVVINETTFGSSDIRLIKIDTLGNTIWTRTHGGSDLDEGWSVRQTSDNGYIIAGATWSYGPSAPDRSSLCFIKTDANGYKVWANAYGGAQWDCGRAVQQVLWDGGYISVGETYSFGAGDYDIYVVRVDTLGDTFWTKTYGGTSADKAYSVQQTSDYGYIIAGNRGGDVYLIKTAVDLIGIEENQISAPRVLVLKVSPNPFKEVTEIRFQVPSSKNQVTMRIYDASGRVMKDFNLKSEISNLQSAVSVYWDGADDSNRKLSNGVYFLKVAAGPAGEFTKTEKLIFLR